MSGIQVSGGKEFGEKAWQEAIQYYLRGMNQDLPEVTYRPKISFPGVTLRFEPGSKLYYAYGQCRTPIPVESEYHGAQSINVFEDTQAEVEYWLGRFVANENFKRLIICLSLSNGYFILWRTDDGGFGASGINLPQCSTDVKIPE